MGSRYTESMQKQQNQRKFEVYSEMEYNELNKMHKNIKTEWLSQFSDLELNHKKPQFRWKVLEKCFLVKNDHFVVEMWFLWLKKVNV